MRIHVLLILLMALEAARPSTPQVNRSGATLEGSVVDSLSREPIRGARVELTAGELPLRDEPRQREVASRNPTETQPQQSSAPARTYSAETERNGRFIFRNLTAGAYRLTVRADGYAPREYGQIDVRAPGVPILLTDGQHLAGILLSLERSGRIEGTVSNPDGEVARAAVFLLRPFYNPEGHESMERVAATESDDRGHYSFGNISPGTYYVAAASPNSMPADGGASAEADYPWTYSPGVPDPKRATSIGMQSGIGLVQANIRMVSDSRAREIRGHLVDLRTGGAPKRATIDFVYRLPSGNSRTGKGEYNAEDGTFEIRNLTERGLYVITATGSEAPDDRSDAADLPNINFRAHAAVLVSSSDVHRLELVACNS